MNKYNLYKWDSKKQTNIGGWEFIGLVHALNESHALSMAAILSKISKNLLRVYPHVDSLPEVQS